MGFRCQARAYESGNKVLVGYGKLQAVLNGHSCKAKKD